jgi:hypothetical protein
MKPLNVVWSVFCCHGWFGTLFTWTSMAVLVTVVTRHCVTSLNLAEPILTKGYHDLMLSGSLVTTAWRVLRLRMEETASRYGG